MSTHFTPRPEPMLPRPEPMPPRPEPILPRTIAILLLSAGYGWAGGHFIPSNAPIWAYIFQFVMLLLLTIFAVGFLRSATQPKDTKRARRDPNSIGLNIFAILTLVINIVNVIRGSANTGPFGSHNDFSDLVPIGLIVLGDVVWLTTTALRYQENRV